MRASRQTRVSRLAYTGGGCSPLGCLTFYLLRTRTEY